MNNQKRIIILVVLALLSVSSGIGVADNSNNILQMDVKKSSAIDAVDVIFYTTGDTTNSVVTRKSNNKYVVLLPNISTPSSLTPGFGGVKDLITNIDVKNVNDGIGGYTKVTFETTKPITIKTQMKKTQPLTQAQKDYKAILAQNNAVAKASNSQEQAKIQNSTVAKIQPVIAKGSQTAEKTVSNVIKKVETQVKPVSLPKISQIQTSIKPTLTPIKVPSMPPIQSVVSSQNKVNNINSKKLINNELKAQKASEKVQTDAQTPKLDVSNISKENIKSKNVVENKVEEVKQNEDKNLDKNLQESIAVDTPNINKYSFNFPNGMFILAGLSLLFGLGYSVFSILLKLLSRNNQKNKVSDVKVSNFNKNEYQNIANNNNLNWQEKYKLYNVANVAEEKNKTASDMSYITNISGDKKVILTPNKKEVITELPDPKDINSKQEFKGEFTQNIQDDISQFEEDFNLIFDEESNDNNRTEIKLKEFSNSKLKNKKKTAVDKVGKKDVQKDSILKKLKTTSVNLSDNNQNHQISNIKNKILGLNKTNSEELEMALNDEYLQASLEEYFSMVDKEKETMLNNSKLDDMTLNRVTNPISGSKSSNVTSSDLSKSMNKFVVKSGYNINSEKGFYVVNIDGASALIGRIRDKIFTLKQFNSVIDKPLQVRPDSDNVYIVKVGKYKCLVDVTEDSMGTLIEI